MEPVLRTSNVARGRICAVCFDNIPERKRARRNFHEIKDNSDFFKRAELWTVYEHEYASVLSKHDLSSNQKLFYHHKCQNFFDERYRLRQTEKSSDLPMEIDDNEANNVELSQQSQSSSTISRRSSRLSVASYETTRDDTRCIICATDKMDSHGKPIPAHTMEMRMEGDELHLAEKQLIEFAEIHRNRGSKYKDAAERIILQRATKSLFAANVGLHNACYNNFRSPSWKKGSSASKSEAKDDNLEELMNLVEYLVIERKEIYSLSQFRKYYMDSGQTIRSIDIKGKILERFPGKVSFCSDGDDRTTDYIFPSDTNVLPRTIRAVATGEGITSCLQLKSVARQVSDELKSFSRSVWPPAPQDLIESKDNVSKLLYNFLAWIACPNAHMGKDGFVKLSANKATVIAQICDNVTALVPFAKPALSQVLLSLSIYAKTGSKLVIDDLKKIGTGISYTETIFILDKWAEWACKQGSLIPGNIVQHIMTTHVFDNIDWSNKNGRLEIHLTNSILIQSNDLTKQLSHVTLQPDYDFRRKDHRSFKSTSVDLPEVSHKKSQVKLLALDTSKHSTENIENALERSLTWLLARYRCTNTQTAQTIPGWSGFQQLGSVPDLHPVTVGYLPPITESPTQMTVIYAEINRTMDVMKELELPFIFIEADQAIYTKVLDAMFKIDAEGNDIFSKIIPRMGGFHILMCMLKTIYSLFKNIGFVQILNAAGLGGMGTIQKYLKGGDVKEGIELHKKLFEAMMRTKLDYLFAKNLVTLPDTTIADLDNLISEVSPSTVQNAQQNINANMIPATEGDMGKLMDTYLDMVNLMLNFIHFTRQGNWEGFLEAIFEFLPYCFRLNRNKYARDLSYYYIHMGSLKSTNPEAYEYLKEGGFSGSLSGLPHSRIPFDQIIEMTINRSCKDIGGLSQNTNNPGATERWTRTNHLMVALREHLNKKIRKQSKSTCRELSKTKIKRDENSVRDIQGYLEKWIPDIWEPTKVITHLSSGVKATEEMTKDSLDIKPRGEKSRDLFLEALGSKEKKEVYYGPIKRQDIKLFSVKEKKKKKDTITSDECQSFSEVFALFDEQKLNLRSILEWPVFSKPWAIVNDDLKSRDNAKSTFRNALQSMAPVAPVTEVPSGISTSIVDGMRVVRMMRPSNVGGNTFRHWAQAFVRYVGELPGTNLHLLFDNYNYEYSVPSKNRAALDIEREFNDLDQELPITSEWDNFLMNKNNKSKLVAILVDYILSDDCSIQKKVYINKQDKCYLKATNQAPRECENLLSKHREADQKIPMHAVFAGASEEDSICVVADDSDIYLSLLHMSSKIKSKLYFRQGKTKDKRGIEFHVVHSLANFLGPEICSTLLAFHALTGSDFTNPFFGRTKVTAFKKLLLKKVYYSKLKSLGTESVNIGEVIDFILHIVYNRPLKEKTAGESRYRMLLTSKKTGDKKKKYPSSRAIVPDERSLKMKILRATFITHCMMNCTIKHYVPLDPAKYGWSWNQIEEAWQPVWYEGNALPTNCAEIHNTEVTENDEVSSQDVLDSDGDSDDADDESDFVVSDDESSDYSDTEG